MKYLKEYNNSTYNEISRDDLFKDITNFKRITFTTEEYEIIKNEYLPRTLLLNRDLKIIYNNVMDIFKYDDEWYYIKKYYNKVL